MPLGGTHCSDGSCSRLASSSGKKHGGVITVLFCFLNHREVSISGPNFKSTGYNLMFFPNISRFVPRPRHSVSACSERALSLLRTQSHTGLPQCLANSLEPLSNLQKRLIDLQAAEPSVLVSFLPESSGRPGARQNKQSYVRLFKDGAVSSILIINRSQRDEFLSPFWFSVGFGATVQTPRIK